ncbi:hypothetical protein DDE82_005041 [Stemphylium lycopersici]|uniref:Uncharacterized protein n=1 Tax=Stemphylium lycopersici TaxID=183478 RepID=A0A364N6K3_STELY|nr:hypothetical protein TW65_05453 [Stemphylium lycopersici]RAR03551.1 hypothetical protein DDE82_005041 [Stemphylium lycopersici]RAR12896.1 hypothetical protein DDE83_003694 [Stemphylium lycopersici]
MSPFMHEAVPHRSKRVRFSHEPSSPTSPSSGSALASTSAKNDATTRDARDHATEDSDTSSILSSSSEEPSSDESSSEEEEDDDDDDDDDDDEQAKDSEMALDEPKGTDGVINLRANRGKKPIMKLSEVDVGPDIRGFLKDFLPQLKAANEETRKRARPILRW